ncbi:transmembrane protein 252 [Perognathus longimembris pacificus]|uniref:transmembrane protein 252 n=1 Tax=Perognathus longimembris pacificus TaxID=214514 RepID=UPI0020197F64|nr:transmembrane protein 252 [Perognathus longimembris pacificus]
MQNRAGLILGVLALSSGFLMICLGAIFISADSILDCQRNLIMAYLLLPLGFVILLSGLFWSTYRQASNNKGMFSHVLRQYLAQRDLPVDTVDRPDFYPPAYDESLDAEKQIHVAEGQALDVPPPLYTETGLELGAENNAHPEAPPPYHESIADIRRC